MQLILSDYDIQNCICFEIVSVQACSSRSDSRAPPTCRKVACSNDSPGAGCRWALSWFCSVLSWVWRNSRISISHDSFLLIQFHIQYNLVILLVNTVWANEYVFKYGRAVPLQAWSGPEGSRKLRFPDFVTTGQDGGRLSALRTGRLYPQEMLLALISVRG